MRIFVERVSEGSRRFEFLVGKEWFFDWKIFGSNLNKFMVEGKFGKF